MWGIQMEFRSPWLRSAFQYVLHVSDALATLWDHSAHLLCMLYLASLYWAVSLTPHENQQ